MSAEGGTPRDPGSATEAQPFRSGWRRIAVVSGVLSFVTLSFMVARFLGRPEGDPKEATRALSSAELRELKARLVDEPASDSMKVRIRELDLALRQEFFERRAFARRAAYLLLAGIAVFLVALRRSGFTPQAPPTEPPQAALPDDEREATLARRALGGFGAALGVSGLVWALLTQNALPMGGAVAAAAPYPSQEELQRNWPRFRGASASGVAPFTEAPVSWSVAEGTNLLWKTPVPKPGWGSPVVWGKRVFLSGADGQGREVYSFAADSGELQWRSPLVWAGRESTLPEVSEDTGLAASTMATDGRRVYAIFATGEVGAFDLEGTQLWARSLGSLDNAYGHASSLVTHQSRLLVQLDQGAEEDGLSKLLALDGLTGETVWEVSRPVSASWSTPLLIPGGDRDEVVLCAAPWVISYDASLGAELWRFRGIEGEVVPAPVSAEGLVVALHQDSGIRAIRLGGRGDVTATHLAWSLEEGSPSISSPLLNDGLLFVQEDDGYLTCYDAKDGAKLWEHELEGSFNASPALVGDQLYLTNTRGTTDAVRAGRQFQELGRGELGERVKASFGFGDGRIYVRGERHLFAIGAPSR